MSWKSVVKQCRFDCVGTGLFSVANMVFLLVFPVLSIVVSLVMISTHVDEHVVSGLMGGLGGLASAMACMSALGPASSEESAGHSAMRGLIPVSRTAQVVGRYLFLLVVGLLWALDVVICGGRYRCVISPPDPERLAGAVAGNRFHWPCGAHGWRRLRA